MPGLMKNRTIAFSRGLGDAVPSATDIDLQIWSEKLDLAVEEVLAKIAAVRSDRNNSDEGVRAKVLELGKDALENLVKTLNADAAPFRKRVAAAEEAMYTTLVAMERASSANARELHAEVRAALRAMDPKAREFEITKSVAAGDVTMLAAIAEAQAVPLLRLIPEDSYAKARDAAARALKPDAAQALDVGRIAVRYFEDGAKLAAKKIASLTGLPSFANQPTAVEQLAARNAAELAGNPASDVIGGSKA